MKEIKFLKCEHCGNIVLMLYDAKAPLTCCGEEMKILKHNSTDGANEKHVPFVGNAVKECKIATAPICEVQVGSVPHPMLPEHFINWIGSFDENAWVIKWLKSGDEPKCNLRIGKNASIYEYCNLHGLWKK